MKAQLIKILKGALIAGAGALLTYLTENLANIDFGGWTPTVVAVFSVVVNILRKVLVAWGAKVATGALMLALLAFPAHSQNLPSFISHGPTIPFYTVTWDDSGSATSGVLAAGAGYSLNFNFASSESGQWKMFTIGVPIFVTVPNGDVMNLSAGVTIGTLNNLLAVGVAGDLIHAGPGADTGLMLGEFHKQNAKILVSINFNFGSGEPNPMASRAAKLLGTLYEPSPPKNYIRF